MGPRWKGKGAEAKAMAEPMSKLVSWLQSSLASSNCEGLISWCCVLLEVKLEQVDLLNRACFGRPIVTARTETQWFQLGLEEAFYLCHSLRCLKIKGVDGCVKSEEELWGYMNSKVEMFAEIYMAYSHLRMKNWVVRLGSQYGADFVVYRHHPALVHSEYAVIVLSDRESNANARLKVWTDLHCAIRVCGSVAKTLLVLHVMLNGGVVDSLASLENYDIEERTITRWIPEQSRESKVDVKHDARTLECA